MWVGVCENGGGRSAYVWDCVQHRPPTRTAPPPYVVGCTENAAVLACALLLLLLFVFRCHTRRRTKSEGRCVALPPGLGCAMCLRYNGIGDGVRWVCNMPEVLHDTHTPPIYTHPSYTHTLHATPPHTPHAHPSHTQMWCHTTTHQVPF